MPQEILIIVVLSIVAGTFTTVVKAILGYLSQRNNGQEGAGSLTASELRGLIESAVAEANTPLERRLDRIESKLDEGLMPGPARLQEPSRDLLASASGYQEDAEKIAAAPPSRTTR